MLQLIGAVLVVLSVATLLALRLAVDAFRFGSPVMATRILLVAAIRLAIVSCRTLHAPSSK
jgi:hypothetical protein